MKAVRFDASIPRYALGLVLRKLYTPLLWSGLSCTFSRDIPQPVLPAEDWIKIQTRYGGICGTDLGTVHLHTSPYFSPFSSSPFTLGHENFGTIAEVGPKVSGWQVGERAVVEPFLWCKPRGFEDLCENCARGEINHCRHYTEGTISPGILMGSCRDTGGSWSSHYLAHASQLYRVPDAVSDENALLVEPFSCGMHAALLGFPRDDETVLILGAGTIGLVTLAALRALGSKARILVSARYPFQAEAAHRLGASEVLSGGDLYAQVAERSGGRLHKALIGKRVMVGGVDRTFECVGNSGTIDDAIRLTRPGGRVILVGVPGIAKGVDWSAIFEKEIRVIGSNQYNHREQYDGKEWRAFDLALELMSSGKLDLAWMITHRFPLKDYKRALGQLGNRRKSHIIKAVFTF